MNINYALCLTLSRIALTFAVLHALSLQAFLLALLLFLLAAATDLADGFVARRFNQATRLGQILDPIADKIFLISLMLYFTVLGSNASPVVHATLIILIAKECILLAVGGYVLWRRNVFFVPSKSSRLSSFFEFVLVFMLLMHQVQPVPVIIFKLVSGCAVACALTLLARYSSMLQHLKEKS